MGERVRIRPQARAAVALIGLGAATLAACGLSASATGGPELADSAPAPTSTLTAVDSGAPDSGDAGAQQTDCTGQTMCGDTCTDLQTDPDNCGMCGQPCAPGDTCVSGACSVLCVDDKVNCSGTCVDLTSDPMNCGACAKVCDSGDVCSNRACGKSCTMPETGCPLNQDPPSYCADLPTDPANCGACGNKCTSTQVCNSGTCVSTCATGVAVGDQFGTTMVGCVGAVYWNDRATLCAPGFVVCSPEEWTARRSGKAPTYNYWTNSDLRWSGSSTSCAAVEMGGNSCDDPSYGGGFGGGGYGGGGNDHGDQPMRVCAATTDPKGNHCKWINCGLNNTTNAAFGGCQGDPTASTLCCTPP